MLATLCDDVECVLLMIKLQITFETFSTSQQILLIKNNKCNNGLVGNIIMLYFSLPIQQPTNTQCRRMFKVNVIMKVVLHWSESFVLLLEKRGWRLIKINAVGDRQEVLCDSFGARMRENQKSMKDNATRSCPRFTIHLDRSVTLAIFKVDTTFVPILYIAWGLLCLGNLAEAFNFGLMQFCKQDL